MAEVLFDPVPGGSAFVEVLNPGPAPADVASVTLRAGGLEVPLAPVGRVLAPGATLLVRFDGGEGNEVGVIHGPRAAELQPNGGAAELGDSSGRRLDRVAWGSEPDAVASGPGGLVPERRAIEAANRSNPRGPGLTGREAELVALVERGLNNVEIARRLGLGRPTVVRMLASAMGKLGVDCRAQLAARERV